MAKPATMDTGTRYAVQTVSITIIIAAPCNRIAAATSRPAMPQCMIAIAKEPTRVRTPATTHKIQETSVRPNAANMPASAKAWLVAEMEAKDLPIEALKLADSEFRTYPSLRSVIFRGYVIGSPIDIEVTAEEVYSELARRMNGFVN